MAFWSTGYAIDLSPQAGDSPTTDEVKITITHSDPSNPICSNASSKSPSIYLPRCIYVVEVYRAWVYLLWSCLRFYAHLIFLWICAYLLLLLFLLLNYTVSIFKSSHFHLILSSHSFFLHTLLLYLPLPDLLTYPSFLFFSLSPALYLLQTLYQVPKAVKS